jgi:hypothetical protein
MVVVVDRRGCGFVYNGDVFGSPKTEDLRNTLRGALGADNAPG